MITGMKSFVEYQSELNAYSFNESSFKMMAACDNP